LANSDGKQLKIGTRGSELALWQAHEVKRQLLNAHSGLAVEIVVISTRGDRVQDRALSEIGGKGLFTQEIEEQLADGRIDLAVHSSKDMPTVLPQGLELSAFLKRLHVRDAYVSTAFPDFGKLPKGAVVGSSSLRRKALLLRMRPDLEVIQFRGNVGTRLQKIADGVAAATLLAEAGLFRLGLQNHIASTFDPESFPPAPGQGAVCIETRIDDTVTRALLSAINDKPTQIMLACERSFLGKLDGSCRTPIAGNAKLHGDRLEFHGMILTPDGREAHATRREGRPEEALRLAEDAATELLAKAGPNFLGSHT